MPELPEVESFRKYVEDTSLHQKIEEIELSITKMLWDTSPKELKNTLVGNQFTSAIRHGKIVFIELKKGGFLLLHFGMTGDLDYYTPDKAHPKSYVLLMHFANGKALRFSDSRMLGKIALVEDVDAFIQQHSYGPDALKVTEKEFIRLFSKRKTAVKTALMNQKIIAGVGNEFSDAILFQCKIHPNTPSHHLEEPHWKKVFAQMKKILKEAVHVNADRDQLNDYFLLNQRKKGLACPRCKGKTGFQTIGGRSSYFCPDCQVLYK